MTLVRDETLRFAGYTYACRIVEKSGPDIAPVLLLPGSLQDRWSWIRHEPMLAARATCVSVELPGWGESDKLPAGHSLDFLADSVWHLMRSLGMGPVNLFGASASAPVAYLVAHRHPDAVARVALCGASTGVVGAMRQRCLRGIELALSGRADECAGQAAEMFFCLDPDRTVRNRQVITRLLQMQIRAGTQDQAEKFVENTRRLLVRNWFPAEAALPCPTLVFTGEHDTLTPPQLGKELAATCEDARFTTVQEADHLVHLERIEEFCELLIEFFAGGPLEPLPYLNEVEYFRAGVRERQLVR